MLLFFKFSGKMWGVIQAVVNYSSGINFSHSQLLDRDQYLARYEFAFVPSAR